MSSQVALATRRIGPANAVTLVRAVLAVVVAALVVRSLARSTPVAPLFVGDSSAPRFVSDGRFPWNPGRRARLAGVRQIGDVVLLRYALSSRFQDD